MRGGIPGFGKRTSKKMPPNLAIISALSSRDSAREPNLLRRLPRALPPEIRLFSRPCLFVPRSKTFRALPPGFAQQLRCFQRPALSPPRFLAGSIPGQEAALLFHWNFPNPTMRLPSAEAEVAALRKSVRRLREARREYPA